MNNNKNFCHKQVKEHDAHQLQKARLEWELLQRRQLSEMCKQMYGEKEKVATDIEKQQQHLDNLAPMLRSVLQVNVVLINILLSLLSFLSTFL